MIHCYRILNIRRSVGLCLLIWMDMRVSSMWRWLGIWANMSCMLVSLLSMVEMVMLLIIGCLRNCSSLIAVIYTNTKTNNTTPCWQAPSTNNTQIFVNYCTTSTTHKNIMHRYRKYTKTKIMHPVTKMYMLCLSNIHISNKSLLICTSRKDVMRKLMLVILWNL